METGGKKPDEVKDEHEEKEHQIYGEDGKLSKEVEEIVAAQVAAQVQQRLAEEKEAMRQKKEAMRKAEEAEARELALLELEERAFGSEEDKPFEPEDFSHSEENDGDDDDDGDDDSDPSSPSDSDGDDENDEDDDEDSNGDDLAASNAAWRQARLRHKERLEMNQQVASSWFRANLAKEKIENIGVLRKGAGLESMVSFLCKAETLKQNQDYYPCVEAVKLQAEKALSNKAEQAYGMMTLTQKAGAKRWKSFCKLILRKNFEDEPWELLHKKHAQSLSTLWDKVGGNFDDYEAESELLWKNEKWLCKLYGHRTTKFSRQRFLQNWIAGMPLQLQLKAKAKVRKYNGASYGSATVSNVYDHLRTYIDDYEDVVNTKHSRESARRRPNRYAVNAVSVAPNEEDWRSKVARLRRAESEDGRSDNDTGGSRSKLVCYDYQTKEGCSHGKDCTYSHAKECFHFTKHGNCKFGSNCRFAHLTERDRRAIADRNERQGNGKETVVPQERRNTREYRYEYKTDKPNAENKQPAKNGQGCFTCKKKGKPFDHSYQTCNHYTCRRCAKAAPGHGVRECEQACPNCKAPGGEICTTDCPRPTFRLRPAPRGRR